MKEDKLNIKESVGTTWGKIDERAIKYKTSWLYKLVGKKYYDSVFFLLVVLSEVYFAMMIFLINIFYGKAFTLSTICICGIIFITWLMIK